LKFTKSEVVVQLWLLRNAFL